MQRYVAAARAVLARYEGEDLVMVTHAGGVIGIVAGLLQCKVSEVPPAAPASVFELVRPSADADWQLGRYVMLQPHATHSHSMIHAACC